MKSAQVPSRAAAVVRGLELGDLVLLLYTAAFVRQLCWPVPNRAAAWALTAALTGALGLWHLRTREPEAPTPRVFWLVVALPLAFFYALRAAFPDMSWDPLDYRLVNGDRGLRGWPFVDGDFFPSRFPFNPSPDMALGIARVLLGYRLGTVLNLLALLWAGAALERLLRPHVARAEWRAGVVLLVLLSEQLLFEIATYMVDLLALPLLLEATRLALRDVDERAARRRAFVRLGIYLGASVAFKLSNFAFAVPLFLLAAWRLGVVGRRLDWAAVGNALGAAALPLVPYTLYIYRETGNPVFPLYNDLFRSPYWPSPDPRTERWGPVVDDASFKDRKVWEILLWPILLPFRVRHSGANLGQHWGRLSVGFVAAAAVALWPRADVRIRQLSLVALLGAVLWSAGSGMHRYALYVEAVAGLVIAYLLARLWEAGRTGQGASAWARPAAAAVVLVLVAQSAVACAWAYRLEWGGRPTFFQDPRGYLAEARHLLRDRSPHRFLTADEEALLATVDVWGQGGPLTGGYLQLLRPDAPQWCLYMPEFFSTAEGRARFARAVAAARGKRVVVVVLSEHFAAGVGFLQAAGLGIGRVTPLSLPFFSDRQRFHPLRLVEVVPPGAAPRAIALTAATGALPDTAFRAALAWSQPPPERLRAGERIALELTAKNDSAVRWPSLGEDDGRYRLFLANHWLRSDGTAAVPDDGRGPLPFDLAPGEATEVPLVVNAPREPGEYLLEVDVVQEGVAWFGWKGSPTLRQRILVVP